MTDDWTADVRGLRVVLADDELLLRQGVRWVLERAGAEVVAEVSDARDVPPRVVQLLPDVLITDIRMPPGMRDDGLGAALEVRDEVPEVGVIVLSQHVQRSYALELLATVPRRPVGGGVGYLLKQRVADVDEFVGALARVAAGGTVLDQEVVQLASGGLRDGADALTERQQEVMALVSRGFSNARIAAELHLTERAVVGHIGRIYDVFDLPDDLEVNRRVLAVTRYLASAPA